LQAVPIYPFPLPPAIAPDGSIYQYGSPANKAAAEALEQACEDVWEWNRNMSLLALALVAKPPWYDDLLKPYFNEDKKLTPGEIKKLKGKGIDPEALKGGKATGKLDLFKDKKGNIKIKPKDGSGPGEPTGININDI
jgi:hypothetical protein